LEGALIAYKLLRAGRVAPFSGVRWPEPGEWLAADAVDECRSGIHACRIRDLPLWLGLGELWEAELDGDVVEDERKVVASRGRLVRRVDAWNAESARGFGEACAAEARRRVAQAPELEGYAADAEGVAAVNAAVSGYMSARLAELQDGPAGYDAERQRQADWLAAALGLRSS
jgi:hypothetical protein